MKMLRSAVVVAAVVLDGFVACSSDDDEGTSHKPQPASAHTSSSSTSGGGGEGGNGGAAGGGQGGTGGCDPFTDRGCCAVHPTCPPGSLGPCVVEVKLCGGTCEGIANPVPNTPCGTMGTCEGTECVEPDAGSAGAGGK